MHTDGLIELFEDGTMNQYHPHLEGSTWYINERYEVVLEWGMDHVLLGDWEHSQDFVMTSRSPPSVLKWLGPPMPQ